MKIDVYSHGFVVTKIVGPHQERAVVQFLKTLILYDQVPIEGSGGLTQTVATKTFASSNARREYYRFHINLLPDFLGMLDYNQISRREIEIERHPLIIDDSYRVNFDVVKLWPPHEYQETLVSHITDEGSNKIVTLQPGGGKTLIAQHSMLRLGVRTSAMMKGGYLDQWQATLDKSFNFGRGQLVKVQGSVYLNAIMEMALDKERLPDCMLISINTYSEYIRHFEANGVSSLYPIPPSEFFEKLKIGFNIFDEGHQFVHQVMKLFTYTNIHKFLTLSGTLDTRNAFNNRMYEIMYPRDKRMDGGYKNVYISVSAVNWQLKDSRSLRYTGYKGAYSHTTFEQNLLMGKNKKLLASYFDMVRSITEYEFVSKMEKGQKMLLFAATEKMCVAMMKDHQKHFPHLSIAVYTSKTKAKEKKRILEECDIIVSTLGSAGTALDIPNLRVSWVTTAVDSQQANDQCLYRTRPMIGWPDIDPRFVYSVCTTIEKHVRYHRNKLEAFRGKVKEHGVIQSPFSV